MKTNEGDDEAEDEDEDSFEFDNEERNTTHDNWDVRFYNNNSECSVVEDKKS